MKQLRAVRALGLPDWCIAAGFVRIGCGPPARHRAATPDQRHRRALLRRGRSLEGAEQAFERRLDALLPAPWQVRNQARMHVSKGLPQHKNTADAMIYWLETVTRSASGWRPTLRSPSSPRTASTISSPCAAATAFGRTRRDEYEERITSKRWRELWPKVRFLD